MSAMSDYLEEQFINHLFRSSTFAKPAALWVSLHTADPTDAGTGTEVSGGSYARVQNDPDDANWDDPGSTGGQTANTADIVFPDPTGNWGTITWSAIFDAPTGGNMIARAQLGSPKVVSSGDAGPKFPAGSLVYTAA
jgi:hypothetical protein